VGLCFLQSVSGQWFTEIFQCWHGDCFLRELCEAEEANVFKKSGV